MSLREALAETRATLANFGDDAAREAQHLLAACLNMPLIAQHTEPERLLDAQQLEKLRAWTERRASGEPLAYLTGRREFWSLEFAVTPDVLVPRPVGRFIFGRLVAVEGSKIQVLPLTPGARQMVIADAPWLAVVRQLIRSL